MKVNGAIEFTITEQTAERVVGEMPVQAGILNPFGVAHAGAILWFADVCATLLAAGKSEFVAGAAGFPLGINLNASFLGNQEDGVFKATAVFVKRGRQLSVVRTSITGEGGRLIADVTTSHMPAQPPSGGQK
jgi:1,4-dihydroxy-2-naphthoyl-CoA hydrolase